MPAAPVRVVFGPRPYCAGQRSRTDSRFDTHGERLRFQVDVVVQLSRLVFEISNGVPLSSEMVMKRGQAIFLCCHVSGEAGASKCGWQS